MYEISALRSIYRFVFRIANLFRNYLIDNKLTAAGKRPLLRIRIEPESIDFSDERHMHDSALLMLEEAIKSY